MKTETQKNFESIFPLEGEITQEILDKANITDHWKCNGALALKEALIRNNLLKYYRDDAAFNTPTWAVRASNVIVGNKRYRITTKEGINFMQVKSPIKFTFILQERFSKEEYLII